MGTCSCVPKYGSNYAMQADFKWSDSGNSWTWVGPPGYCNPYNCSNKACVSKGCAQARAGFCQAFGVRCPSKNGRIVCYNECPDKNPPPADPDQDCNGWGPLKGLCIFGKGGTKVFEGIADPIQRYGPFVAVGFGALMLVYLLKK